MKSLEKIEEIYKNELQEKFSALSAAKKNVLRIQLITFGLIAVPVLTLLIFTSSIKNFNHNIYFFGILFSFIILGFIGVFYSIKIEGKYRDGFKQRIFRKVFNAINSQWIYQPDKGIPESEYNKSGLFSHKYDWYEASGFVEGYLNGAAFECSEIKSKYKTVSFDNDKKQETWHTIFKGMFFHSITPKHTNIAFSLKTKTANYNAGNTKENTKDEVDDFSVKNIDCPGLDSVFSVYSATQKKVQSFLTPTLIDELNSFYRKYKVPVSFSFDNSDFFFAVSFKKNIFQPRIFKSLINFYDLQFLYDVFDIYELFIKESHSQKN
ncbi:MAG: DUF3137 domain-containing protein [Prolixibacteraceae bacterium]|jgi:hypothetical protein|nr:DUF3137 domain-containing protein [Prolixibacteraceae bacterium]